MADSQSVSTNEARAGRPESRVLADPTEAEASDTAMLRSQLMARALATVERDYHKPSRSHIYYSPDLGPLGVKGYGNFPNEAYEQFHENLSALVDAARAKMLKRWTAQLEAGAAERQTEARL